MSAVERQDRVCVFGNAGGGKSALARQIASAWDLPYHEADRIMWTENWERWPTEDYLAAHDELINQNRWVIDGNGFTDQSILDRCLRSGLVILIDLPLWQHYWLVAERHMAWSRGEDGDYPTGNASPPPLDKVFEMMAGVDRDYLPKLRAAADTAEHRGSNVVRLESFDELKSWSAQIT